MEIKIPNKKQKKVTTLIKYLGTSYGVFAAIAFSVLIVLLTLGIIYVVNKNNSVLLALAIILPTSVVLILISVILAMRTSYKVLYTNLYGTTMKNYENLKADKRELTKYEVQNIKEFEDLNKTLNELIIHNNNSELIPQKDNYSKIPLEYFDKKNRFINETSFKKYIREIIYNSQSFRNAVVSVTYDEQCELDPITIKDINATTLSTFPTNGTLIVLKENGEGFYIYVPRIESISFFKETLDTYIQKIVITKKTIAGIELVSPKINVVIYPYSNIEDIFSDLLFAERQNFEEHIYIPKRLEMLSNVSLFHSSMNLNNISKMISNLASVKEGEGDFEDFLSELHKTFEEIVSYYSFDQAGLIIYDPERKRAGGSVAVTNSENVQPIFKKLSGVNKDFTDAIKESVDEDGSIYFSSRKNVSSILGRQLDIYGISSGYFYCIKNVKGDFLGAIYFINTDEKQLKLNTYMQESLLVLSTMVSVYVKNALGNIKINEMRNREQNILKMTNIRSYTIDKDTFEIISYSPSLKEEFPNIDTGRICYKEMFGYDKPCGHCPLVTKQRSIKQFKNSNYEVSYSINTKMSNYIELILNKVEGKDFTKNRFDPDLLINTYYSFTERLQNLYLSHTKGYIVLLNINNSEDLVMKLGNEGYSFLVRCFTHEVNEKLLKNSELYLYKNNTLAIIYPEIGKLDVVDNIEKVYDFSKRNYLLNKNNVVINATYEAIKFPQEHTNVDDLIRHLELVNKTYTSDISKDIMYIEENDYTRPASREEYILSIINEATITKNFIIKAQPVLHSENKTIFGAEILIRLSDEYRASLLNTEEMIHVAANHDKLNVISDMLIDYVGALVKQFGYSIFKSSGFNRMSINADFNYFKEANFRNKIVESVNKYHFPKNFLTFEIAENDFAAHYEDMQNVIKELKDNDINVVVDHYTGEFLSFDKVKVLGCDEVKVDRKTVVDIDVVNDKYESLRSLMESAKAADIQITLVGVENGRQYELIKNINPQCNVQGYYFHHPLDQNELIEAIRTNG